MNEEEEGEKTLHTHTNRHLYIHTYGWTRAHALIQIEIGSSSFQKN